ncbi:MAG: type I restriction enzyme M protein [Urechidicola sp.]|jgi:type I restriction enzyme M protein
MFEKVFKNIDDILRRDGGCKGETSYVEQTSWIIFLKYLSDLEIVRSDEAELSSKKYVNIFPIEFSWDVWACPKLENGKIDHDSSLVGDDLIKFVNEELFEF